MLNLCIDIGNTLLKLAIFSGSEMVHFEIIEKSKVGIVKDMVNDKKIKNIICSSVAENPTDLFSDLVHSCFFITLNENTELPIINCYETPETLGRDRIAAVIGAQYLYPNQDVLVIDAGSAITYDIITKNGEYLGGNIAPGIQMRYKALNTFTKRLPLVSPSYILPEFGKNTTEAIRVGVQMGIIHEVDGTISFFKDKFPDMKILLTGGDASYFDNKLKNIIFAVSNLVMIGLNRILLYNLK